MKAPSQDTKSLYQEVVNDDATWVDALFWYALGVISAASVIMAL